MYLSSYLGAIFEGEFSLVTALQASFRGHANAYAVLLTAFAGTLTADWFVFLNGRYNAEPFLRKRPKLQKKIIGINTYLDKRLDWLLLFYRFIYGFRIVLPLLFGLSPVSVKKFALFSLLSTSLWLGFVLVISHFISWLTT